MVFMIDSGWSLCYYEICIQNYHLSNTSKHRYNVLFCFFFSFRRLVLFSFPPLLWLQLSILRNISIAGAQPWKCKTTQKLEKSKQQQYILIYECGLCAMPTSPMTLSGWAYSHIIHFFFSKNSSLLMNEKKKKTQ